MNRPEIAQEIANQIGNQALMMIGAKQLGFTQNSLTFKVGRNAKAVTHVRITLNSLDLYDMEFLRIRGTDVHPIAIANDCYSDMMNRMIETHTGLYTKL
jgi:hypothetical protein